MRSALIKEIIDAFKQNRMAKAQILMCTTDGEFAIKIAYLDTEKMKSKAKNLMNTEFGGVTKLVGETKTTLIYTL